MLDGIAFLPIGEVNAAMEYLEQNIPNVPLLNDLFIYFDSTYCRGPFRNNNNNNNPNDNNNNAVVRFRRAHPMFPPAMWNVYNATLHGHPRTNNVCEGWNHAFFNLVGHKNPSIWTLINAIKMDQSQAVTLVQQIERGIQIKRKQKNSTINF